VQHFGKKPELVPVAARVFGEREEMPAHQPGLVAFAFGQFVIVAVALQGALRQMLAAGALGEAAGVVVVLEIRLKIAVERGLHGQAWLLEIVIAARDPAGTGFHTQAEALDHRLVGNQAAVLLIGGGGEPGEDGLVIAEDQHMTARTVLEVIVDALFLAQALDEVQVGFVVLHAVLARRVDHRAEPEAVGIGLDTMLFEHLGDDLRHRQVLEDALVGAMGEVGQLRHEREAIAGQALTGFTLGRLMHQPMNTAAIRREGEEGRAMQQAFQIQVGALADQFQVEAIGLADGFTAAEFEHLEVVLDAFEGKREVGLVGWGEHPCSSCSVHVSAHGRLRSPV